MKGSELKESDIRSVEIYFKRLGFESIQPKVMDGGTMGRDSDRYFEITVKSPKNIIKMCDWHIARVVEIDFEKRNAEFIINHIDLLRLRAIIDPDIFNSKLPITEE